MNIEIRTQKLNELIQTSVIDGFVFVKWNCVLIVHPEMFGVEDS